MKEKPTPYRLLADENTSHRFVAACRRLVTGFSIVHIATWENGSWRGLDDAALLIACAEHRLVLVAFDRATLPWHAGQVLRAGESHGGLVLFRRSVRSTDYGYQARLLTGVWTKEGEEWDWGSRIVYLPKSPTATGPLTANNLGITPNTGEAGGAASAPSILATGASHGKPAARRTEHQR